MRYVLCSTGSIDAPQKSIDTTEKSTHTTEMSIYTTTKRTNTTSVLTSTPQRSIHTTQKHADTTMYGYTNTTKWLTNATRMSPDTVQWSQNTTKVPLSTADELPDTSLAETVKELPLVGLVAIITGSAVVALGFISAIVHHIIFRHSFLARYIITACYIRFAYS